MAPRDPCRVGICIGPKLIGAIQNMNLGGETCRRASRRDPLMSLRGCLAATTRGCARLGAAPGALPSSVSRAFACAGRFEQKPDAPFGLVDPDLKQTRCRHIAVLIAKAVCFTHMRCEVLVVVTQLRQHVEWRDVIGVVVQNSL